MFIILVRGNFAKNESIILEQNFVTPFDVRTEVRLSDFKKYREKVNELKVKDKEECIQFILDSKELYCTKRRFNTVVQMVQVLNYDKYRET